MRGYFGLSTEKDKGYTYVVVASSALWSGLFFGIQIVQHILTREWKTSLGLPFMTAPTHQIVGGMVRYFVTTVASAYVNRINTRILSAVSCSSLIMAYVTVYLWHLFHLPVDYFIIAQIIFGIFNGISSGVGYATVNIVTQQWLDKKRAKLNPYIMAGSPIFALFGTVLFSYLCDVYTWSGAILIQIGILLHSIILIILYAEHPDYQPPKEAKIQFSRLSDAPVLKQKLFKLVLAFNLVKSVFIIIPFFTQTINIATEYGLASNEIEFMLIIGTVSDIISRPIFSALTKKLKVTQIAVIWAFIHLIQNVVGFMARDAMGFYLLEIMLGIGLGASGLKMVVITDCLGVDNLGQYLVFEQMISLPLSIVIPFGLGYLATLFSNPSLIYLVCIFGSVVK